MNLVVLVILTILVKLYKYVLSTIEFCPLCAERLVPCGGNMTGRHNGTIKKENKNIYLKIMVSPPEQVSMEYLQSQGGL